jgi:hypothetical protein
MIEKFKSFILNTRQTILKQERYDINYNFDSKFTRKFLLSKQIFENWTEKQLERSLHYELNKCQETNGGQLLSVAAFSSLLKKYFLRHGIHPRYSDYCSTFLNLNSKLSAESLPLNKLVSSGNCNEHLNKQKEEEMIMLKSELDEYRRSVQAKNDHYH